MRRTFVIRRGEVVEKAPPPAVEAAFNTAAPSGQEHLEIHTNVGASLQGAEDLPRDEKGRPVITSRRQIAELKAKNPDFHWSGDTDPTGRVKDHIDAVRAHKRERDRDARALDRRARFNGGDPLASRGRFAMPRRDGRGRRI